MRSRVLVLLAVAVSLLAAVWWLLLPASLGGRATYVVTHGVSMQPRFHTGDLAIVYPAAGYHNGEIAAYRSELLGTTVLHRIIGGTSDGYLFKGDHNTWVDPEQPSRQQIVGRLAIRVPQGGVALGWVRQPLVLGLLAVGILTSGATGAARLRRRRRARAEGASITSPLPKSTSPSRPSGPSRSSRWIRPAVAGTAAVLLAGLGLATYLVPGQIQHAEKVPWTTQVQYAYTAATAPNLIYPDGRVRSGQTVFRKLVNRLTVRATWSLHTPTNHHLAGAGRLEAIVQGPDGWTYPVQLGSARNISGDQVTLAGTLDLAALDAAVDRAANLTGIPTNQYTVSVRPVVRLNGAIAGTPLPDTTSRAEPALSLVVTPSTVGPAANGTVGANNTTAGTQSPGTAGDSSSRLDWLNPPATTNSTTLTRRGPATWHILSHNVPVAAVRWASASGAALGLLAALVLALATPRDDDPCAREARRHRAAIIEVSELHIGAGSNVLEVSSFTALARVARRYDRLILHQTTTPWTYLVEDETGIYRYQCTHRRDEAGRDDTSRRRHLAAPPQRTGGIVADLREPARRTRGMP